MVRPGDIRDEGDSGVTVLTRYIVFAILRSVGVVLTVLVSVTSLFQFVSQLDDIGVANFGFGQAVLYVLLSMPRSIFQSLPAATLLGALLALGNLATLSELVAMRSSGVSKIQLLVAVGTAGALLAGVMALLGESFAPSLGAYAREMRSEALLDEAELADGQSSWLRDDNVIVNVRRGLGEFESTSGVYLFELNDQRGLESVAHADTATIDTESNWSLSGYAETRFARDRLEVSRTAKSVQQYGFNTELLGLSIVREDMLDTPGLQRYIAYLRANNLDARRYLIAYWGRWADMLSVPFMALLALPFVFGSLRSAGSGARLVVGLCIGLGFYVADEVLTNSGAVFDFDPLIVAWGPTFALVVVTLIALWRAR